VKIALMKDVPDVSGDRAARIRTFSVRIGQKRIFIAMKVLLQALFVLSGSGFLKSATTAGSIPITLARLTLGIFGFGAALSVNKKAAGVDPEDSADVYEYYMHLWKLFYLSYLVLPFAR
jgi:homogentisate phytyltransferase/homogentisate geranylgeranyltransferase